MTNSSYSTSALHILQSPDGYYTYLQIPKQLATHKSLISKKDDSEKTATDKTKIEKNYRKLSLRLHPDRPGGDAETFRMLERAKCVLMSDKLRKEYDLLGLDLDEEEHHDSDEHNDSGDGHDDKKSGSSSSSNPHSILSDMAGSTVAGILQLVMRTGK